MKQYIILISALIFVIVVNIFQHNYLKKTSEILIKDIDEIKISLDKKEYNNIQSKIQKLDDSWKVKKEIWDVLTEHDDVEDFQSHLASLKAFTSTNDYNESINEIAILRQKIEHILENEKVSFATVF